MFYRGLILYILSVNVLKIGTTKLIVSVQHVDFFSIRQSRTHVCGGVLLTRSIVLTSCNCVTTTVSYRSARGKIEKMDETNVIVQIGNELTMNSYVSDRVETKRVKRIFVHPSCDEEYAKNFALLILRRPAATREAAVVRRLFRKDRIRQYLLGEEYSPVGSSFCSISSWILDDAVSYGSERRKTNNEDDQTINIANSPLESAKRNFDYILHNPKMDRDQGIVDKSSRYIAAPRIDVVFVDKNQCAPLISSHKGDSGFQGLQCGEWCVKSMNSRYNLCLVDAGSPIFCNTILVGVVSQARVVNCSGPNAVFATVAGLDEALSFIETSVLNRVMYSNLPESERKFTYTYSTNHDSED